MKDWLAVAVAAVSAACAVLNYRLQRRAEPPRWRQAAPRRRTQAMRALDSALRARSTATAAVGVAGVLFVLSSSGALQGSVGWQLLALGAVCLFAAIACLFLSRRGIRAELAAASTFLAVAAAAASAPALVPEDRAAFSADRALIVSGSSVERKPGNVSAKHVQTAPGDDLWARIRIAPRGRVALKDVGLRVRVKDEQIRLVASASNAAPLRRVVTLDSVAGPAPTFVPDSAEVVIGSKRRRPQGGRLLASAQSFSSIGGTDVPAVEVTFAMRTPQPSARASGSFACCNLFRVRNENERFRFDDSAVASRGDRIRFRLLVDNTQAGRLANIKLRIRQRATVAPMGIVVAELSADNADQRAPTRMRASVSFVPPFKHRLTYVGGTARLSRGLRGDVFVRRLSGKLFTSGVHLGGLSADIRNHLFVDFVMLVGGRTRAWSNRQLEHYDTSAVETVSAVRTRRTIHAAWSVVTGNSSTIRTATRTGPGWSRPQTPPGAARGRGIGLKLLADQRDVYLIASTDRKLKLWFRGGERWSEPRILQVEGTVASRYLYEAARDGVVLAWSNARGVWTAYGHQGGWRGPQLISPPGVKAVRGSLQLAVDRNGHAVVGWTQRNATGRRLPYVATETASGSEVSQLVPVGGAALGRGASMFLVNDPVTRKIAAVLTGATRKETLTAVVDPRGTKRRYTVTAIGQPTTYAWDGSRWRGVRAEDAYKYSRCCPGGPDHSSETQATISQRGDSYTLWTARGSGAFRQRKRKVHLEADRRSRSAGRAWGWGAHTAVLLSSRAPIHYRSIVARDRSLLVVAVAGRRLVTMYGSSDGSWSDPEPVTGRVGFGVPRHRRDSSFAVVSSARGVASVVWAGTRNGSGAVFAATPADPEAAK